jgi:hypothetical protein
LGECKGVDSLQKQIVASQGVTLPPKKIKGEVMFEKFTFDDLEKYDLEEVRRKRDVALSNVVNDIRSALVEIENYNLSKIEMIEDFNEKLQELEEIHKKLDYLKRWLTKQKNVLKKVKS